MALGKFKLSETLRFLSHRINAIAGRASMTLDIELDRDPSHPGGEIAARVILRSDEESHEIDYIALTMRGTVQRDGAWRDYTEGAEVAQGMRIAAAHEVVLPVVIHVPDDAVLSADGGTWLLEARAIVDGAIDPRARAELTIAIDPDAADSEEE